MGAKPPRFPPQSRYRHVAGYSRRSVLGMGLGALAALAGCRSSDDDVFVNGNAPTEANGIDPANPPMSGAGGSDTPTDATMQIQLDGGATAPTESDTAVGGGTESSGSNTQLERSISSMSNPDSSVQSTTTASTGEATTPATSAPGNTAAPITASSTTQATTTGAPATTASTTTRPSGPTSALPAGADLVVNFTYEQAEGGKNVPPYIAVWIEDDSGDLVETVALWYQQFGRGENWLPDLRRWYNTTGGSAVDSGPTRAPGRHQVAWGGSSEFGEPMPPGRYYVCVESARERGPYSLVRAAVDLNGSAVNVQLGADAELEAVSARTA